MKPLLFMQAMATVALAAALPVFAQAQEAKPPLPAPAEAAPPPARPPIPVAVDPPPAPPSPAILHRPVWLERPTAEQFAAYYPTAALDAGVSGDVVLDCIVAGDGRLSCAVRSETPPGIGFGVAAIRLSRYFRVAIEAEDGQRTPGARIRLPIRFRLQ